MGLAFGVGVDVVCSAQMIYLLPSLHPELHWCPEMEAKREGPLVKDKLSDPKMMGWRELGGQMGVLQLVVLGWPEWRGCHRWTLKNSSCIWRGSLGVGALLPFFPFSSATASSALPHGGVPHGVIRN